MLGSGVNAAGGVAAAGEAARSEQVTQHREKNKREENDERTQGDATEEEGNRKNVRFWTEKKTTRLPDVAVLSPSGRPAASEDTGKQQEEGGVKGTKALKRAKGKKQKQKNTDGLLKKQRRSRVRKDKYLLRTSQ